MRPVIHWASDSGHCCRKTHKGKKYRVFSIFPVFANDRAITKTRKTLLEDSLCDGTSNEISTRFQCGAHKGHQKALSLGGFGLLRRTIMSVLTHTAGSKLREIVSGFPLDPLPQFLNH